MSKKSSQNEPQWPSTQQMLLDHLRRIVEGVACTDHGSPDEQWFFGFEDCLVSCSGEWDDPQFNKRVAERARIELFLSRLNVEAKDHPSGPIIRKTNPDLLKSLAKVFADRPSPEDLFRKWIPENLGAGLEEAYAFEMLNKLDQVVGRSKQEAVQKILFLENVPEGVDDYMAEAAACFRYGFDKACLAVCRTALEEMLKRRIEYDHGKKAIQTYDKRQERWVDKDLYALIQDAHTTYGPKRRRSKYLNGPHYRSADQIRKWGNGAVHGSSSIPRGVVESRAQKALLYSKQILEHLWSSV